MKNIIHYYFGQITEKICGYEFTSSFIFRSNNLNKDIKHIEKNFRKDADDIQQKDMEVLAITIDEYTRFNYYLPDLTIGYE